MPDIVKSLKNIKVEEDCVNVFHKALWNDYKGNWERAHEIAQIQEGTYDYDRIHAYLHRKEGDLFNARWWYNRIGIPFPKVTLEEEWEELVLFYENKPH